MKLRIFMMIFSLIFCLSSASFADSKKVMVFAAASTTNAITDIGALFVQKKIGDFTPSFASSSTLAKQIEQGAPADVYISANPKWMTYLEEKKQIDPDTRFDLLGNRIVLIAPLDSPLEKVSIKPGMALDKLLCDGRLAMGDPDHVPAGIYGRQALTSLDVWKNIESKIARTKDVRAALALVERGETPLGIVYATDAAISQKIKVVGMFPEDSHPAITYPAAIIAGKNTPAAKAFLDFLKTPDAKNIFEKYGFTTR